MLFEKSSFSFFLSFYYYYYYYFFLNLSRRQSVFPNFAMSGPQMVQFCRSALKSTDMNEVLLLTSQNGGGGGGGREGKNNNKNRIWREN